MSFSRKVDLTIENSKFLIKTIEKEEELERVLNFRHKIFYEELLNKTLIDKKDYDKFDLNYDHIIVIDKDINEIISVCRLITSNYVNDFYSEIEFNIDDLKKENDIKLELGRVCIHEKYRSGIVLYILWHGIHSYAKKENVTYIFGCSSIKTLDFYEVYKITNYLNNNNFILNTFNIFPRDKFKIKNLNDFKIDDDNVSIPSIFKSYLKIGAKVVKEPILDEDFRCVDFFTLLNFKNINKHIIRKFENNL